MYEGRLLKKLAIQAVECGKGAWVKNMAKCCWVWGQVMEGDTIKDLPKLEIYFQVLPERWGTCGRRRWRINRSLPRMLSEIAALECESSCGVLGRKRDSNTMLKLRGGTAAFQIEVGMWRGAKREETVCKECSNGEVEDGCSVSLHGIPWGGTCVSQSDGLQGQWLEKQTAFVLSVVCLNYSILNHIRAMWCAGCGLWLVQTMSMDIF